jgi:hypothetical protein
MLIKASDKSLPDRPFVPTLPDNFPEIGSVPPRREVRAMRNDIANIRAHIATLEARIEIIDESVSRH